MSAPVPVAASYSPSLGQLLAPAVNLPVLLAVLAAALLYGWGALRAARAGQPWPWWRTVLFALGLLPVLLATQTRLTDFTLGSMALYMVRLMVLAEVVPPLLLLGLPPGRLQPRGAFGTLLGWLLDPWVALALWTTIIVFWNVPAGFNASLVSNTAGALLPALYLAGGLLTWGVVLRPLPGVQASGYGNRGWFGLLSSLPMMAVAAVWLYSPQVLYTPYVGALCLWNTTPLQNQTLSGYVMMVAGIPGMALALTQLLAWLIALADSGTVLEPEPEDEQLEPAAAED